MTIRSTGPREDAAPAALGRGPDRLKRGRGHRVGKALAGLTLLMCVAGCARAEHSASPTIDPSSQRTTVSGPVVGFRGPYDSHVWRGIPYAAPPVGAARWRAPQPPTPWTDTRVGLEFGSPCVQYASQFGGIEAASGTVGGSEDCLFLNVYAPRVDPQSVPQGSERWPVMMWIHGGGNSVGTAGFYDGGHLAAAEHVIVVTVNYRLGPLGWFRHAALRADAAGASEQSGNFTVLDLIAALTWIRDNIAAFGGDPNTVTIFGESAGAQNVFMLLLSPPARGLFHRAVAQSGGFWPSTPAQGEHFSDDSDPGDANSSAEALVRMLIADGTAKDRAAAKARLATMRPAEVAAYLRGTSSQAVMAAYPPTSGLGMIRLPTAFGDGVVLPDDDALARLASSNGYNRVPVMLGTNRDENKLFMFGDPHWVRRYFWIVPRIRDERMYNLTAEYLSAMWKASGADMPAAALRHAQSDVFVYRFDWDEEPSLLGTDLGVMLGAAHSFEIPFVFGHFDLGREGNVIFTDDNQAGRDALAKQMMGYWGEFARSGAPRRGGDPTQMEWTAWDPNPGGAKFAVFDSVAGGGTRMAKDALTRAGVLAALDADTRLQAPEDKCTVLRALAQRSRGFSAKDYAARSECAPYPLEEGS